MQTELRSLVVGIAQPGSDDPAVAAALRIAEAAGATLHAVYAYPPPPGLTDEARHRFQHRWTHGEGQRAQEAVRSHVLRYGDYPNVTASAVPGPAAAVIHAIAVSRGADLVVVGATRHGRIARAVLGTTAHRVLRDASAPVLLVRNGPDHRVERVLLTTDLTPLSGRVHERALQLLRLMLPRRPELRTLFVTGHDPQMAAAIPNLLSLVKDEMAVFMEEHDAEGVAQRIRTGFPGAEILAEAASWSADLLVLGTHSRRGPARLLLGSVAEWVLQRVPADVLVLPACASHNPVAEPLEGEVAAGA